MEVDQVPFCELSTLSSHASALLYCVALLVKYLICESYLVSITMEKHAGCLKIHSGGAAMQELTGPAQSTGGAQGTGMEWAGETEGEEKEKWAERRRRWKVMLDKGL